MIGTLVMWIWISKRALFCLRIKESHNKALSNFGNIMSVLCFSANSAPPALPLTSVAVDFGWANSSPWEANAYELFDWEGCASLSCPGLMDGSWGAPQMSRRDTKVKERDRQTLPSQCGQILVQAFCRHFGSFRHFLHVWDAWTF